MPPLNSIKKGRCNSNDLTTDGEYIELLNFLIEKTEKAPTPLRYSDLARAFKEERGVPQKFDALRHRIETMRPIIQEMKHIEMDTKVKLMFALSAPVNDVFLEELKNQAVVVLDDHQRIIKYGKKGGGLELEGVHRDIHDRKETIRRDKRMMEFLVEKSKKSDSPYAAKTLLREFQKSTGVTASIDHLHKRYRLLRDDIYKSDDFDQRTKIRMLFVYSVSVPEVFLELLRKDAMVEVAENNRITKYKANNSSLELTQNHSHSAKEKTGMPGNTGEVIESDKKNYGYSSEESDSDNESHLDKTRNRANSFRMVPLDVMNELIRELYADVVLYNEVSQRFPEFVPKMFNEATRKKLDAFLKVNNARRLTDIVTDRMFKKRKRAFSFSGNEPSSKKIAAKESPRSRSSHDKAVISHVMKTGIQKHVNLSAKRDAVQKKKKASNNSDSDSDIPVKKWTPPKKSAQTPAQKKAASSSDSGSEDEALKKISVVAQKAASKKVYSVSSSSSED